MRANLRTTGSAVGFIGQYRHLACGVHQHRRNIARASASSQTHHHTATVRYTTSPKRARHQPTVGHTFERIFSIGVHQ